MRQKPPGGRKVPHGLHLPPDYALDCLNLSDPALSLGSAASTEHAPPAFPAPIYSADQSANAGPCHDNQPAAIGSAPQQQSAGSLPVQEDCLATIPFIDEPTSPSVDLRARLVSASSVVSSGSTGPAPNTGHAHVGQRSTADHALSRVDHAPSSSFSSLLSHKLHLSHYSVKSSRRSSYLLAVMTTRSKSCDEGLNMFREEQHALGRRPKRAKSFLTDEVLGSKRHSASELDSSSYSVSWREGWLHYKQLQTGGSKKVASGIRPWRRAYAVLRSHLLFLYKDKREAVLGGGAEDEQPINIAGCLVDIAYSETRRKNVLRLSTQDYSEHLLQAADTDDMLTWVLRIRDNSRSGSEELSFSKQALINKKLNDYRKQCVAGNRPDSSPRLSRMKPPFLLPKSDSPVPPRSPKPDTKDESPPKSPWGISLMKRGRRAGAGPKAFGVRLDECQPATTNKYVPLLVEVCCGLVEGAGGLDSTGIYRVPGNNAAVCSLQEALNRGADINTADEKWQDLNVVSSLLKSFFRKLPEPLFTDEKYSEFIEANRMEVASGRLRTLKKLIHGLPDHHFYTLKFLLGHLKTVAEHADKNKMEARNLALVFGPTLVRMSEDNMMDMVTHMPDRYKIVETLLQHYEWFFSQEVGKEEKTPVDPEDIQPAPNIDHLLSNIGRTGTMGEPLDLNTNESAKSKGACPDVLMLSIMSAVTKRRRQRHQAPPLSNKESELQPITASITVDPAPKAEGEEDDDDGDDGDDDGDGNDGDDDGDGDDLVEDGSARVPSEMLPVVTKGQQSEGGVAQSFMVSEYSTPSTTDPTPSTIGPTSPSTGSTLSNMDPAPSIIGSTPSTLGPTSSIIGPTPSIIGSTPSTLGRSVCEEADDEYSELDTESSSTSPPAHTHTPTHTQTHTPNITHAATTSTSCLRAGPSHSRLLSRPSFSSHKLMQCDTLARKRQKGGLRTRPPELLELPLDSFGQGAGPTSNPSSLSPTQLWPIGVGEGEGLLRARLSPETRRRRRAWRRHTVVASPTEPPVAPGNKPSLATPTARPTDVTTATSPPQTSRFHQFL
ncbi:hypothetical protein ACEWY4_026498 [Coilia grayii]|uniref:Rho GTPase-activating protein 23-like n=1 Tax=Coilia grayii TaxID=363190 RepID=A0ABD1IYZ1_9TELE